MRAPVEAPISKRDISRAEIESLNYGQEMPFLLSQVPSITQYADSGAPAGYSYIYLRGIPQTRMNVTIDGMPINEPEDSAFYFSNFGDLANAVDSIQVQRGVGTSSVGAASFVGSINFASATLAERAGASVRLGTGSFGQQRFGATVNSGHVGGGFRFYGQAAAQASDGFREHSDVSQQSVYLGALRESGASYFKIFGFIGREKSQLAYLAADEATLEANLRANPMSPDERDEFGQRFVTAQYHRALSPAAEFSLQGVLQRRRRLVPDRQRRRRLVRALPIRSGLVQRGRLRHLSRRPPPARTSHGAPLRARSKAATRATSWTARPSTSTTATSRRRTRSRSSPGRPGAGGCSATPSCDGRASATRGASTWVKWSGRSSIRRRAPGSTPATA